MNKDNGYDNTSCTEDSADLGVTESDKSFPIKAQNRQVTQASTCTYVLKNVLPSSHINPTPPSPPPDSCYIFSFTFMKSKIACFTFRELKTLITYCT